MTATPETYECKYCHNEWSLDEGFRLDTMQCAGCQKWDDDKPKRDAEMKELMIAARSERIDFPYVAGDPYW